MDNNDKIRRLVEKSVSGSSMKSTVASAAIRGALEGLIKVFIK